MSRSKVNLGAGGGGDCAATEAPEDAEWEADGGGVAHGEGGIRGSGGGADGGEDGEDAVPQESGMAPKGWGESGRRRLGGDGGVGGGGAGGGAGGGEGEGAGGPAGFGSPSLRLYPVFAPSLLISESRFSSWLPPPPPPPPLPPLTPPPHQPPSDARLPT
ncbi:hypothetical protein J437_LFUL017746 [Ladona fulva]|uniref:Uncharacterized protein n=1 Tax=Ladona fulva TaxID=123851 RepID=A0A8K0KMK8_LADFU|nr:hypothetical protein J437_LFUL017746 [Ladona fulva]